MNLNEIKFVRSLLRKKSCALTQTKGEKRDKKNGRRNTHDSGWFDANSRGDFDARERRLRKAFLPL